jgi:hypothetical protein
VIKEVIKEVPAPAPTPPMTEVLVRNGWEGIWRPKSQLPMFGLKNVGGRVTGVYAAQGGRVLRIQGGAVVGDSVEVVVDDGLFRVRFGLRPIDSESMKVEAWITDDDWLISLSRANKLVNQRSKNARTGRQVLLQRQRALLVGLQMQANIMLTRKPSSLGVFYRGSENRPQP